MARSSNSVVPAAGTMALSLIDQELSNEAALLRKQIDAPTGNKLRVETVGDIILPDGTNLGNDVEMIVIDFYNRHFFYLNPFDKNNITPPDCYAIGKVQLEMAPEDDSPHKQHNNCPACPMNQYKSHRNGTAKACQNRYWVAVLIVDRNNPEAHNDPTAPVYILDLSPTNRKSFEAAVTAVTSMLGGAIKAKFRVTAKNVGTYAAISFMDPVPNPNYAEHFARRPEVHTMLTRKPDFAAYEAAQTTRQPARRPAARR